MSARPFLAVCVMIFFCPSLPAANCPSGGATIFYANGLNTDMAHAIASGLNLRTSLLERLSQTGNSIQLSCLLFELAPDYEFIESNNSVLTVTNFLAQLLDAGAQQGIQMAPSTLWGWLTGSAGGNPPPWFASAVSTALTSITSVAQPNLQLQLSLYQQALNAGNRVVVVAHSQGNLYVNQAFVLLSAAQQADFRVVAIATPAPTVPNNGPWYTLDGDVITLVPGHSPEDVTNDPPSVCLTGNSIGCHDFDNSYLTGDYTRPGILDATISAIPLSQPAQVAVATNATLDGSSWPSTGTGAVAYLINGPQDTIIGQAVPGNTPNILSGQYTFSYESGGPPNSTLVGVLPCPIPSASPSVCTQTVSANQTFLFTLVFQSYNASAAALVLWVHYEPRRYLRYTYNRTVELLPRR